MMTAALLAGVLAITLAIFLGTLRLNGGKDE